MLEITKDIISALKEKKLSGESVFDGKILHVRNDVIELPNKKTATREVVGHNGAVCIVALKDNGNVIMEYQYRYAVGEVMLEIPAGKLDSREEDPRSAAIRELREETGAIAEKLTYLGQYIPSPAILEERIYMYLAEGLTFTECDYDEDEFMTLAEIPLEDAVEMALSGLLPDGKTQAALLRVYLAKEREGEK